MPGLLRELQPRLLQALNQRPVGPNPGCMDAVPIHGIQLGRPCPGSSPPSKGVYRAFEVAFLPWNRCAAAASVGHGPNLIF